MQPKNEYEKARREVFLTQKEAAEILGVEWQTVSNWERGKTKPHRKDVLAVYRTWRKRNKKG
jgi:DNA-binding XRE family transcriptional regulator